MTVHGRCGLKQRIGWQIRKLLLVAASGAELLIFLSRIGRQRIDDILRLPLRLRDSSRLNPPF